MRAEARLWRTADGGLVADGDPDGAILAYAAGDDISPADEAKVPRPADSAETKAAPAPANKARARTGDKSGDKGA